MFNKNLIIEVGVNTGTDTNVLLEKYPDCNYIGFEPTLELYTHLIRKYQDNPRVRLYPIAISNKWGNSMFNIAGQGDWGCSSLHNFTPDIEEKWPGRSDFKFTDSYPVPVMPLSYFINAEVQIRPFEFIEYLWIDAQGEDLNVLRSMEVFIGCVLAGRLETSYTVDLYEGTDNKMQDAIDFLTENGFDFTITPDATGKECNIEFFRK